MVDFLDADLAGAHVATLGAELLHAGQGQFAQIAVLHARTVGGSMFISMKNNTAMIGFRNQRNGHHS